MFRPRSEAAPATVTVSVEGRRVRVAAGASAAAAVLAAGLDDIRETATGSRRAPYCMIGVCWECLAEIDGVPSRQSCMVEVAEGMTIRRQIGPRRVDVAPIRR
jgi:predicted molibdopterin-dependent oxidoreductase YjgC